MPYATINIDIDDVWSELSASEQRAWISEVLGEMTPDEIDELADISRDERVETLDLADPAVRLDAINWLRRNGWSVEPV